VLLNWTDQPISSLTVTVPNAAPFFKVTTAQGATVQTHIHGNSIDITLLLDHVDVLMLDPSQPNVSIVGAPSSSPEGTSVHLTAKGDDLSGVGGITFTWNVTKDGAAYSQGSGTTFTFTPNDNASFVVTLQGTTSDGRVSPEVSATITVTNVAAKATIAGPSTGVPGQPRTFTFMATDPSSVDQGAGFTYLVHWGDGSPDQKIDRTAGNGAGVGLDHTFTDTGSYMVTVTATDKDDATSPAASQTITVVVAEVQVDADGKHTLVVGGTTGDDTIKLRQKEGHADTIVVRIREHDEYEFNAALIDRIVVYGQAGNDRITIDNGLRVDTVLFGGAGDDQLEGGGGNNVLVGGAGEDQLRAGSGRDLLIGGAGSDRLTSGNGDNMLIAGFTDYDADLLALGRIESIWAGTDTYEQRIAMLTDSAFAYALSKKTVHDDNAADVLIGGSGRDWYLANFQGSGIYDQIKERKQNEVITDLG
jgi:Ca2+-binding RTX toxin-like protein